MWCEALGVRQIPGSGYIHGAAYGTRSGWGPEGSCCVLVPPWAGGVRPCDDDEAPIVASLLTYYTKWPGPILWKEMLKDSRPRAGELAVTGGPQSVVVPFQKRKSFANFVFGFPADRQVGVACLTRTLRRRISSPWRRRSAGGTGSAHPNGVAL